MIVARPGVFLLRVALLSLPVAVTFPCSLGAQPAEKTVVEWRFDADGEFRGWTVGGHLADVAVSGGALRGRATDWDPILFGPVFEMPATPTQCVEIKLKSTQPSRAELFWTETLEGKYGGFSQEKYHSLQTHGDGQFHVYRMHPFWHAAGKIIRLRFDPPSDGRFEIEWIRIVDQPSGKPSDAQAWKFDSGLQGWRAWQAVSEPVARDGCLVATARGKQPILMSPRLSVPPDDNPIVSLRMATDQGSTGQLFVVSSKHLGWESLSFPLRADGRMHSYNIDVSGLSKWRDDVVLLGVQPTNAPDAEFRIESIAIADDVRGPAELEVVYFGRTEGVNRTGRPANVTCVVANRGGEDAGPVGLTLKVPQGVTAVDGARKKLDAVSFYLKKSVSWQIASSVPSVVDLSVEIEAPGLEPVRSAAQIEFTRPPDVSKSSSVPEPRPVKSDYQVGVFYFPGWHSISRWRPIFDFPMRKPVLGWYDESNPQCADWQIKWAVEHGISFFMVDWYWSRGNRHLEHWLHDAYMKAKHRKYLKWAVMWANHNAPGTHSAADWEKVTRYWIDNYFGMQEYYRIDGRPAIFIWAPANIRRDVGGTETAAKLYARSQQMARDAGYPGIYFVAMSSHESEARAKELKAEGYEAFTSYHGFQLAAQQAGSRHFKFERVVETANEVWQQADQRASGLLYLPIVDSGWASEPWHHSKARVISGRTPELFGQLCRRAREYADRTGKKIIAVGPCNEWGEGSYIEPYTEYGFQDLDRLREAFCPPSDYPPNLIPSDVGLGPYDLKPEEQKTAWEFNTDGDFEGWTPNGSIRATVAQGMLAGSTHARDPILQGPGVLIEARRYRHLVIRMKCAADDRAQFFWGTTLSGPSERNSVHVQLTGDGRFHTYEVDLAGCRTWRGVITSLRFDPVSGPGAEFVIDSIRLK